MIRSEKKTKKVQVQVPSVQYSALINSTASLRS